MFKRNLIITGIIMLLTFAGSVFAQERHTTKITKSPKPNIEGATNQKPKQILATKGRGKQEMPNAGDLNTNQRTTSGGKSNLNRKPITRNSGVVSDNKHPEGIRSNTATHERRTKSQKTTQVTGGTIPVYKGNQRKRGGVTDTDNWTNSKTKRRVGTKPIVILDQDTQTIKARRKRKGNK